MIALIPHIVRAPEFTEVNLRGIAAGNDANVKLNFSPKPEPAATAGNSGSCCAQAGARSGACEASGARAAAAYLQPCDCISAIERARYSATCLRKRL